MSDAPSAAEILRRNHVQVIGQGPRTIVFAHGFGCDQRMWRFVAPHFAASHRVVLFDHVGAGRSDIDAHDPVRHATLEGYAEDILQVLDALAVERCVFVGHSIASVLALLAAARQPQRFERLVLVAPSPRFVNDPTDGYVGGFERADIEGMLDLMESNHFGWAQFLAPLVMSQPNGDALTAELEDSLCALDRQVARSFARITFLVDCRALLPQVQVPSLLLQCQHDGIAPTGVGAYMHARMPQSTLQLMDVAGHCPHMSHPAQTIQAIEQYLAH